MQEHCEIGEMYLKILKGSCESREGEKCEYCLSHEFCSSADIYQNHTLINKDLVCTIVLQKTTPLLTEV